jgi:cell division protein FtsN
MTDIRAEDMDEGDRLPWLEAVDEDQGGDGPSMLKLIVAVLIGLIAIGGIVGGLFWMGNRDGRAHRGTETIAASSAPYKIKPQQPGGMHVEGQGDSSFAASAGADPKGRIDTAAVPEAPVTRADAARPPAAKPVPVQPAAHPAPPAPRALPARPPVQVAAATPAKPKPAAPAPHPAPAAAGPGGSIQLGAFSSQAGAEKAWKALAGRFAYLAPLSHNVVSVSTGGKTLYRLRAGGPDATGICSRLKVAGETCVALD